MIDSLRRPDAPRRAGWLVRGAVLASAIAVIASALGGIVLTLDAPWGGQPAPPDGPWAHPVVAPIEERGPISFSEALANAAEAGIAPETLLATAGVVLGIRASYWGADVFEIARYGSHVRRQAVAIATHGRLGENHVYGCVGCVAGVSLLYGTAAPDVVRVAVAHARATGGAVANGAWLVVIEGDDDPTIQGWAFLRADGSSAQHGTGIECSRDAPRACLPAHAQLPGWTPRARREQP
jgi:hypothetical protein